MPKRPATRCVMVEGVSWRIDSWMADPVRVHEVGLLISRAPGTPGTSRVPSMHCSSTRALVRIGGGREEIT